MRTEDPRSPEYIDQLLEESESREARLRIAVRSLITYAPPQYAAKLVIDSMPMAEWSTLIALIVGAVEEATS